MKIATKPLILDHTMTIRELKELVKDLPEASEDGEEYEVWIQNTRGISNPVNQAWQLNQGDLLLEANAPI